jgi:hypothetical protein
MISFIQDQLKSAYLKYNLVDVSVMTLLAPEDKKDSLMLDVHMKSESNRSNDGKR